MGAPLGFKTFTTGDVLTAADTNGYLMQGVWTFASAAARDAAVTSPQEGNMCYLKDTDAVQYYSGSAWTAVGSATFNTGYASYNTAGESTSSTSFTALTTAVATTVTTGTKALVSVNASAYNNSNSATAHASTGFAVSGATTKAAADEFATQVWVNTTAANSTNLFRYSGTFVVTGLTAGSNTFSLQHKVGSSESAGFYTRSISVVNLGS